MRSVPKPRPYRCMRGGVILTTPTNLGGLALYNNSSGAELLVVWLAAIQGTAGNSTTMGVFKGKPPGTSVAASPMITDQAVYAGQLVQLDTTTTYPVDVATGFGIGSNSYIAALLPWVVLSPGFSWVMQDYTTADPWFGSIIWQSSHVDDLRGHPCHICDPAHAP